MKSKPRLIAFYLPQYHPIPENDEWWGKGFTEWTNVAKAKPLFRGHYQPHLPADLGFYDLRVPEVRDQQAELAREAGIEGFCYWHYWFAGKQLLERPFNEVLESGKPDFPFCVGWANESWTGVWHGAPDRILIEQTYPGVDDHRAHFEALLPAFKDPRYICVDGKPIIVIQKPGKIPDTNNTLILWKEMAIKVGLRGLYFIGIAGDVQQGEYLTGLGYDAVTLIPSGWSPKEERDFFLKVIFRLLGKDRAIRNYQKIFQKPYHIYDYDKLSKEIIFSQETRFQYFPAINPGWDNSPRSGLNAFIVVNSTPEKFYSQVFRAINRVRNYPPELQFIFIKSWNEWAEGNYLEPDALYGSAFLSAVKDALEGSK